MKKFNVKALSLAVAAAVVSGAAAAEEVNFAKAVGSKEDQGQAAFATVFGEGTTYDKGTGKLTFKKDSDALLLKTLELEQTINGFASGSNFITTDANGNKTVREATNEDIEADSLKGVGLAGGLTAVNARVDKLEEETDDQDETIEELKTAITTNGTRIAEVATGVNKLNESVAEMGKDISTKFDEVDSEISKASFELSESIEKVSEDVTAVNKRVDTLEQETAAAKTSAKAAEDKVTELSANVDSKVTEAKDAAKAAEDKVTALSANIDSKVKEAKDAAANAVDAASKIDAVAEKADKANKAVDELAERAALSIAENAQQIDGFKEGDEIVVTNDKGIKSIKKATKEDVEQDEFGGLGLKEVAEKHDQSLADLTAETERAKKAAEQAAFAAIENAQELNGFKEKDEIIVTDDNGVKSVKTATEEDVKADEFKGLGLKEAVKDTHKAATQATLAAIENAQELNGFKEGDQIVVTKDDGSKVISTATKEDVEADGFGGKGLKKVVAAHGETLDGLTKSVTDNKALLAEQGEANEGFNNAIASLDEDVDALKKADLTTAEALEAHKAKLEANRKDIDANKALLAEQGEANEGFNNAIASLDEDVDALKKADLTTAEALEAHKAKLEANRKDIDANKALLAEQGEANEGFNNAIASLDEDVDALKKADLTTAEALEAHKAKLEANRKDIDANKALLAEQGEANEGFNNAITSLGEDISTLKKAAEQAALASVENAQALNGFAEGDEIVVTDKDGIKSIKTATKEDVKNADFEGMGLKEVVNDISKGVTANTDAIKNKADQIAVESVKTIAVDAQKSAQAAQGAVKEAQESAKAAQASAVTANNVASAAQTAAAQAQDAVKANAAQVATNKADIATLQTASSQHAAGIAKNSARIDSLDKNVANLRKETRQGLAAQAALSGLFQPYSVGKFNVTAALGGFKSDTAVAVGAGYRFNENFAAKAGLAVGTSSGGSASYNVGVNYEW